ncbi:hypothetical protein D9M73_37570 [compost metagenome]|uniref:DUF4402 domain-containing protein n=1 Tax=Polaromonas aquatica TaxID=332657 RepID=A0ABW1TWG3_9BURK|nr:MULTISPECIES: hypothetical protein [unclassified Polaromonas]
MIKNEFPPKILRQAGACALLIGSLALTGDSDAGTATGTASATVLQSVSVTFSSPFLSTISDTFSGTTFTIERFTGSLSLSGPLLRVGPEPSPGAVLTGAGAAPSIADNATVYVSLNADGSLSVSGGSGLTYAVSQPGAGVINIEYN